MSTLVFWGMVFVAGAIAVGSVGAPQVRSVSIAAANQARPARNTGSVRQILQRSSVRYVVAVCVLVSLVWPMAGLMLGVGWYVTSIMRRRAVVRSEEAATANGLAEVVELFALTLASGGTLSSAVSQMCLWAPPRYAAAFVWSARQVELGRPLADVLQDLPLRIGVGVQPLVAALVAHDRYGAAIGDNLARLAADARADQRRRAETAARRLPVTMLFPLVVCVLPAFLLLTVVPVVADTITGLNILASP